MLISAFALLCNVLISRQISPLPGQYSVIWLLRRRRGRKSHKNNSPFLHKQNLSKKKHGYQFKNSIFKEEVKWRDGEWECSPGIPKGGLELQGWSTSFYCAPTYSAWLHHTFKQVFKNYALSRKHCILSITHALGKGSSFNIKNDFWQNTFPEHFCQFRIVSFTSFFSLLETS